MWAVGVGAPGIVDDACRVRRSVAIDHWAGVTVADELGRRLEAPVLAVRDTHLAVLAEHRGGAARGYGSVLYVHVGRRLGVGILVDGRPFTGNGSAAGEIGRHPGFGWTEAPARLFSEAGAPGGVPRQPGGSPSGPRPAMSGGSPRSTRSPAPSPWVSAR